VQGSSKLEADQSGIYRARKKLGTVPQLIEWKGGGWG
jgi:hypothetical protein